MDQVAVVDYLNKTLTEMFPQNRVFARIRNLLGENNIHLTYTHFTQSRYCASGIWENDPAYMCFAIWNDAKGFHIDFPATHCSKIWRNKALKFRKISGKTEQECAEKLMKWFEKNRAMIMDVED